MFGGKGGNDQNSSSNTANSATNEDQNSNTNSALPNKNMATNYDLPAELAKTQLTEKLDNSKKINGKIAIVADTIASCKYYSFELLSSAFDDGIDTYGIKDFNVDKKDVALNPDDIDTLIIIECAKGKKVGSYDAPDGVLPAFSNDCVVRISDYASKTVYAKKAFTNSKLSDTVNLTQSQTEVLALWPYEKIQGYISEFPRN